MNLFRTTVPALAAALLSAALIAAPARAAEEKKDGDKKETVLHTSMESMGKSLKALKKSLKDPAKKDESLGHVAELKKQTALCKAEVPAMVAKAPEAERAKLVDGYKKMLDAALAEFDKLEGQIRDGKTEAAQETLKALKSLEDDGHEKYNP